MGEKTTWELLIYRPTWSEPRKRERHAGAWGLPPRVWKSLLAAGKKIDTKPWINKTWTRYRTKYGGINKRQVEMQLVSHRKLTNRMFISRCWLALEDHHPLSFSTLAKRSGSCLYPAKAFGVKDRLAAQNRLALGFSGQSQATWQTDWLLIILLTPKRQSALHTQMQTPKIAKNALLR